MVSGGVTSVTIILIVFFLFKEGIGLFGSPTVEQGYVVAVNRENTVRNLSPVQLKEIFDSEVTNWSQYGGADEPIVVFRIDDIDQYVSYEELGDELQFIPQCLSKIIADHPGMIAFFPDTYLAEDFAGRIIDKRNITPGEFFLGDEWFPTATPAPLFGIVPLVMGTLWVSLAAILFALPLGMAVAIYIAELAHAKGRKVLKPVIELLAGVPARGVRFFRVGGYRAADSAALRIARRRNGFGRECHSGYYGPAYDYHRGRRLHPQCAACRQRGLAGPRCHPVADHPPRRTAVLRLGYHGSRGARYRTCHRGDHGGADGDR